MCYAIPGMIKKLTGETAVIDYGGVRKEANISLLDNAAPGEYVLVHAGFAIQKVDRAAARDSLDLIENV